MKQIIPNLKAYIKRSGLRGYSNLRKAELVSFILNNINVDTGKPLKKNHQTRKNIRVNREK